MQVEFLIEGATGQRWDLVHSPRLPAATWHYLRTITLTNHDHIELQDVADGTAVSYYRLRSP